MLTPEVLRIATQDCADYLGRSQRHGSIEPGKEASFILVDGNPAQEIAAIRRIRIVLRQGILYFPSEIYSVFGITPFLDPPAMSGALS